MASEVRKDQRSGKNQGPKFDPIYSQNDFFLVSEDELKGRDFFPF
jgi:hypothetical protein